MNTPLSNRVAVITGATHGLGKAIALHLASLGSDVVLLARGQENLARTTGELDGAPGRVLAFSCDVSDKNQVQETAARILSEMGRVDVLINNAGIPAPRGFAETGFADWDEVIGVNLNGVFYMTRALWDALVNSGHGYVINISGTLGLRGGSSPAYGSAKTGLTGLTRATAVNGKPHNLRATVLYPGGMDTGWRGAPIGVRPHSETMDPQKVAELVGYLLTTPQELVVNEAVLNPIADPFV